MKINNKLIKEGTVLWTNPNPTSSFATQTITLSSNDYDFYEVYCAYSYQTTQYANSYKSYKNKGMILWMTGYSTNTSVRRKIDWTDSTHLLVSSGMSANSTNDAYLIPLYIIGYKTNINL